MAPCFRRAGLCSARAQPSLRVTRWPFQSLSCKQFVRSGIVGKACNLMVRETGRGAGRAYQAAFRLWGESLLQSSASLEGGVMFLRPGRGGGRLFPQWVLMAEKAIGWLQGRPHTRVPVGSRRWKGLPTRGATPSPRSGRCAQQSGVPRTHPNGASKGRGQGQRLGWGGGHNRPQPAGSSAQAVKLPPGTEAGSGGGRQVASPRRAALQSGRGCWEGVRPAGRLGDGLLMVTDPTACSVVQPA